MQLLQDQNIDRGYEFEVKYDLGKESVGEKFEYEITDGSGEVIYLDDMKNEKGVVSLVIPAKYTENFPLDELKARVIWLDQDKRKTVGKGLVSVSGTKPTKGSKK